MNRPLTGFLCFVLKISPGMVGVPTELICHKGIGLRMLWEEFNPAASRLELCLQPVKGSVR